MSTNLKRNLSDLEPDAPPLKIHRTGDAPRVALTTRRRFPSSDPVERYTRPSIVSAPTKDMFAFSNGGRGRSLEDGVPTRPGSAPPTIYRDAGTLISMVTESPPNEYFTPASIFSQNSPNGDTTTGPTAEIATETPQSPVSQSLPIPTFSFAPELSNLAATQGTLNETFMANLGAVEIVLRESLSHGLNGPDPESGYNARGIVMDGATSETTGSLVPNTPAAHGNRNSAGNSGIAVEIVSRGLSQVSNESSTVSDVIMDGAPSGPSCAAETIGPLILNNPVEVNSTAPVEMDSADERIGVIRALLCQVGRDAIGDSDGTTGSQGTDRTMPVRRTTAQPSASPPVDYVRCPRTNIQSSCDETRTADRGVQAYLAPGSTNGDPPSTSIPEVAGRVHTRGSFFVGNGAPVTIDENIMVKLKMGVDGRIDFLL